MTNRLTHQVSGPDKQKEQQFQIINLKTECYGRFKSKIHGIGAEESRDRRGKQSCY